LFALGLNLERCQRLITSAPQEVTAQLTQSVHSLQTVIRDLRGYIAGGQMEDSRDGDLTSELTVLARTMEATAELPCRLDIDPVVAGEMTLEQARHIIYIGTVLTPHLRRIHGIGLRDCGVGTTAYMGPRPYGLSFFLDKKRLTHLSNPPGDRTVVRFFLTSAIVVAISPRSLATIERGYTTMRSVQRKNEEKRAEPKGDKVKSKVSRNDDATPHPPVEGTQRQYPKQQNRPSSSVTRAVLSDDEYRARVAQKAYELYQKRQALTEKDDWLEAERLVKLEILRGDHGGGYV
jgi:hypothetical protein